MRGVNQGRADSFEQGFQFLFSFDQRKRAQIFAIEMQKIEDVVAESAASFRQRLLQRAEIGVAFLVGNRDFAVE